MQLITEARPKHIKEIVALNRENINKLRKLNKELHWAYQGKELTRYQLIYQIVFLRDTPNN